MNLARRIILAFALMAGITPAMAQVPAPVPALPDTERRTSYTIAASQCNCAVNFALYGDSNDYWDWLEVWVNGARVNYNDPNFGWVITVPSGTLGSVALPITNASLTFNNIQTGTVQIVGARRPRRTSQFNEGVGVPTRNFNVALSDLTAQNREAWDKINDVTGRAMLAPAGETLSILQPAATRASQGACFDANGNLVSCTSVPGSTFIAGSGIHLSGSNPTTISFDSSILTSILNAFCTVSPGTCALIYGYGNVVWWGADPTGVADSATAFNSCGSAIKKCVAANGTFRIASSIKLQPAETLSCQGATITQGSGANLAVLVDIFTNTPNGAQLDHCTIDGNFANNTNVNTVLVDVSGVSNVNVLWNTLTGSLGGAVNVSNSTFVTVEHNLITHTNSFGIAAFNTSANISSNHQFHYNTMQGPMLHMLQLQQIDGCDASGNVLLQGVALGGAGSTMQVTISGTTATWVSGTNFAGVTLGDVLVVNGGAEFPIASVNSNTSLTLTSSGSLTNVPASIGGGDVLSLTNVSFTRVSNNLVLGGVTGGIVLSQSGGAIASTETSIGNVINANLIQDSGNFCIALEAPTATGSPQVSQTVITSNFCIAPGRSGPAGPAPAGIQLFSATNLMVGVTITGNYLYDPFSITGGFWLTGSGSANATNVAFGVNSAQGFANGNIMSGYPTFASLPFIKGLTAHIIDGSTTHCDDAACTTWGTPVTGGGGTIPLDLWFNGANFTIVGK